MGGLTLAPDWPSHAARNGHAQQKFHASSTTFKDGEMMPSKVGNSQANEPKNPSCLGENVSPQLSWAEPPAGTKSFAFLMVDPEGRGGGGVIHWVAYGIPPGVTGFTEGEVSKDSSKYVGGKSRRAWAISPGPACRRARQRGITHSFWSQPISSRTRCRPA